MFGSLLLTIYFLFLLTYIAVMSFALYRVFIFGKNKALAGYSRKISITIIIISLIIIFSTFSFVARYDWDDNFSFWVSKVIPRDIIDNSNRISF